MCSDGVTVVPGLHGERPIRCRQHPTPIGTLTLDDGSKVPLVANFSDNTVSVLNQNAPFTTLSTLPTGVGPKV